jgi:hypothetical protein
MIAIMFAVAVVWHWPASTLVKSSSKLRHPTTIFTFKHSDSGKSEVEVTQMEGEPSPTPEKDGEPIYIHQTSWPKIRIALYRLPNGKYQFFEQMMRERGWTTDQGEKLSSPRWVTNQGYRVYETDSEARAALTLFAADYEEN